MWKLSLVIVLEVTLDNARESRAIQCGDHACSTDGNILRKMRKEKSIRVEMQIIYLFVCSWISGAHYVVYFLKQTLDLDQT